MTAHFNRELEQRLLSSMMKESRDVQGAVGEGLSETDFYDPLNSRLFRALRLCASQGDSTDTISVWRAANTLCGDKPSIPELAQVENLEPTSLRRVDYTRAVMTLSRQRQIIARLTAGLEEAKKPANDWADLWERVHPAINGVMDVGNVQATRTTSAMVAGARQMLTKPDDGTFIGPFPQWDRQSKRLRAGQLVVLAGRPGTGKTALALMYATAALTAGKHAAFFSLEMAGEELLHRAAHQNSRSTRTPEVLAALDRIPAKQFHIFEARDHATLASIEAKARLLAKTFPMGIVVIDYLGLVRPPRESTREQREQQVAAMSRAFKLLAASLGCPLLLLHQLNRESEKDQRRPRLSDLRESGAIEQDADVVWLLWEKPAEGPLNSESERVEVHLIQAKRRNGQPNIFCRLQFDRPILTFTPIQNANQAHA